MKSPKRKRPATKSRKATGRSPSTARTRVVRASTSVSRGKKLWTQVDEYLNDRLLADDSILDAALADSNAAGLPPIAVTPTQGKLLQMLAEMIGARSVLEVGTLGGYSTIWLARALPNGGRVITLELDAHHADVARRNFKRASLDKVIEIRVGPALQTLPEISAEQHGPFDLVFIDADKENVPAYFEWAIKLSRSGSLIIVDNVVRDGAIADPHSKDPRVNGVQQFLEQVGQDSRVAGTAIQTVGAKGYDGLAIVRVL